MLLGRLVPGVRSFVSLPAGVQRMPLPQFVLYTALGSSAYNAVLVRLGYLLGSRWASVPRYSDLVNYAMCAGLGAAVAVVVVRRLRRRRSGAARR